MNEWDVICELAAGATIEVEDDGTYRLVKRISDLPDHIVNRLNDIGMLQGPNSYRLSDDGHRYYMQRVDGQKHTHVADPLRQREIAEADRAGGVKEVDRG